MKTELMQVTENMLGAATMTSREIAELTGKNHFHVKRDIEKVFCELGLDVSKFGCIYLDAANRQQTEYVLDQELTFTLVTGYSIKLRNAVVKRWLDLERQSLSLQANLNRWCAKEHCDQAMGSLHGKGLAERKKTKRLNQEMISSILHEMQPKLV